jgi:rubredoxin
MTTPEADFHLFAPVFRTTESREIGTGPRRSTVTGLDSAEVQCVACGHEWRADEGRGVGELKLRGLGNPIDITCPECGKTGFGLMPKREASD